MASNEAPLHKIGALQERLALMEDRDTIQRLQHISVFTSTIGYTSKLLSFSLKRAHQWKSADVETRLAKIAFTAFFSTCWVAGAGACSRMK
jgi:hypothetical protein